MFDLLNRSAHVNLLILISFIPVAACGSDNKFQSCLSKLEKHTDTDVFDVGKIVQVQQEEFLFDRVIFDKSNSHNASFSMCEFYEGKMFNIEFILNGVESRYSFDVLTYEKIYDESTYLHGQREGIKGQYVKREKIWLEMKE